MFWGKNSPTHTFALNYVILFNTRICICLFYISDENKERVSHIHVRNSKCWANCIFLKVFGFCRRHCSQEVFWYNSNIKCTHLTWIILDWIGSDSSLVLSYTPCLATNEAPSFSSLQVCLLQSGLRHLCCFMSPRSNRHDVARAVFFSSRLAWAHDRTRTLANRFTNIIYQLKCCGLKTGRDCTAPARYYS